VSFRPHPSPPTPFPLVVALIATCQRHRRLAEALRSVAEQSHPPDIVIVVDDGPADEHDVTRACLARAALLPERTVFLGNRRTRGAAGAWNSGLDEATRRTPDPAQVFIAILDDDDRWERDHLRLCLDAARERQLDLVAAGIVRVDDANPEGRRQSLPARLDADDALTNNPHIQGSNLFVRLSVLLEAGLFDESLRSTTDRDLLVRLVDLGTVRFGAVEAWTVQHDARTGRPRLSVPGSTAKSDGLRAFWRKHRLRMSSAQQQAYRGRALDLFDCADLDVRPDEVTSPATRPPPESLAEPGDPIALVAGIIADGDSAGAARVAPLLEDLLLLRADPGVASLGVVVMENGPVVPGRPLHLLVERLRSRGLELYLVPVERQFEDATAGVFGTGFVRTPGRVGIGAARTMVQRYVYDLARRRRDAVAWILDDDKRLDPILRDEGGGLRRERWPFIPVLRGLRSRGVHVALGRDTAAPPLPILASLRVQLVDLAAHLGALASQTPDAAWPDRAPENARLAAAFPDYYYDLARGHTAHLEQPCWYTPSRSGESARDVFLHLAARAPRMLAGEQVFRPLFFDPARDSELTPSWFRGGSTFVFDLDALRDVPNCVPDIDGRETRRSDMIWCALNASCRGRRIVRAPLPVLHDRSCEPPQRLDVDRSADDIRGYALFRVLADLVERRDRKGADDLQFSPDELAFATHRYEKYLHERTAALALSFHRARGACVAALRFLRSASAWWHADPTTREAAERLVSFVTDLVEQLTPARLDRALEAIRSTDVARIETYLEELRGRVLAHASGAAAEVPSVLCEQRRDNARSLVERLGGPAALQLLGEGAEGVCFADGERVYKCFDAWASTTAPSSIDAVRGLVGRWQGTRGLYPLLDLREDARGAVLVYPYEPSSPYTGGHGPGLVRLLRECRANGIVCRNLHPANLRVVGDDVRLIDYGRDLVPWSEAGWRQMLRRAWLTWRWPHLPHLKSLMRRALDEEIPEVDGWERLRDAVEERSKEQLLDELLLALVRQDASGRVLDFGCGKARLAASLAAEGVSVVGYDPELPSIVNHNSRLEVTANRRDALCRGPFDAVVCSLVLCVLDDDAYRRAVQDLRAALRDGGRAYIACCNPFFTMGGPTPLQTRELPPDAHSEDTFAWNKVVHASGARRRDVHRPFERLRRDLLRAGLAIEEVRMSTTVDLARFEPASDFLVLIARAVPPMPTVSLVIRACAQEWRTLGAQVRHLVDQLEGPAAFHERVLVADGRTQGFARPYDVPDRAALLAAAEALVRANVIDRVVLAPTELGEVAALHARWFGESAEATHTAAGAPLSATLAGFEACTGDYLLQVDADLLVVRRDRQHDYLREMVDELARDPRGLTAALNICHADDRAWSPAGADGPWRVEVRGALFDRARLCASRPWRNPSVDGVPALAWQRALDEVIRRDDWRSYRGGDHRTFFVHPPNALKVDRDDWLARVDRAEAGHVPAQQRDHVEVEGDLDAWLGPQRTEAIVVIACGRDVPSGRFMRWLESLRQQSRADWGAVVIDDGGTPETRAFLRHVLAPLRDRVTLLGLREHRGGLANTVWALRHVCCNPESIIALVDADDALLGREALGRVADAYASGADLTIGSMLRTDKHAEYPVDLAAPRARRGGNVWQHLRTFRRRLFDEVPDEALRLDGRYVDLAWDWALMLPLVERAERSVYIGEPLYLYEPSGEAKTGAERERRESIIGRLVAKPSLRRGGGP